jgi:hypothetical protein
MRIAFLVLNHREPAQLLRLLKTLRLQLPDAPIVVHNDKFRIDVAVSAFDSIGNTNLLTSDAPGVWGNFSVVESCWRAMAWMIENLEFDWVILLSAQDYPIKPLATLQDHIATTGADALLRAMPINELRTRAERRDKRRRYLYQYRSAVAKGQAEQSSGHLRVWLRRNGGLFVDVLNNAQPFFQVFKFPDQMPWSMGWRAGSTPFSQTEPCWFGSHWFGMSYRAAELVTSCHRDRRDYVEYYRRTIIPEESATATLLYNSPRLRVEPRDLHYVRWTQPTTGHPDIFTVNDLPELLSVPEYFARKFDVAVDTNILDRLDEVLGIG